MNLGVVVAARSTLDRWVLLTSREAAAAALSDACRGHLTALVAAGEARYDAALGARGATALVLARASVACFLEAAVVAALGAPIAADDVHADLWARFDDLVGRGAIASLPEPLRDAQSRLRPSTRTLPEAELAEQGERLVDEALGLARHLAGGVEVRTVPRLRLERAVRLAMLALVGVIAVAIAIHRHRQH